MTTAGTIVERALRENNLIPLGSTITAAQEAEGVARLQAVFYSMLGTQIAQRLIPWPTPNFTTAPRHARYPLGDWDENIAREIWPYPPANARLITRMARSDTLYFQQFPCDGAQMQLVNVGPGFGTYSLTLDANGMLIEGASSLVFNDDDQYTGAIRWMFRADRGEWIRVPGTFTATTELPFPPEFDDFWSAILAVRLAPAYGKEPNVITLGIVREGSELIASRYFQDTANVVLPDPWTFNGWTSYGAHAGLIDALSPGEF